jgi:hypothetical protein
LPPLHEQKKGWLLIGCFISIFELCQAKAI